MQLQWWYWVIAGFSLIGLELIFPSFTIIWLGLGALAVGVLKAIWPGLPAVAQLLLWPAATISFSVMWFKYLRPLRSREPEVPARDMVDNETGVVVRCEDRSCGRWTVRFPGPLLGADEWCCYADVELQVGDRVRVTQIDGQVLKVARL